jgi:hypothetical protein|tara:strand:- start:1177 stop:1467 length:291 start_codon:yes stop_codon:yes gene_type:complete
MSKKNQKTLRLENEFWKKINNLRELNIPLEKIQKKNKDKEEKKRKIIRASQIILANDEILEGVLELYTQNMILKMGMDLFINYYISTFKKYVKDNS